MDALFNQLTANLSVEGEWRAGTQFPQPLSANSIGQSPKAEYRNVRGVSFAGRDVFREGPITTDLDSSKLPISGEVVAS